MYDVSPLSQRIEKPPDRSDKCWFEDPLSIFTSMTIVPSCGMTDAQRINAITRLIIVIAVVLFFIPLASWWIFLILGLILVGLIFWSTKVKTPTVVENYRCFSRSRRKPRFVEPKTSEPSRRPEINNRKGIEKKKINLRSR